MTSVVQIDLSLGGKVAGTALEGVTFGGVAFQGMAFHGVGSLGHRASVRPLPIGFMHQNQQDSRRFAGSALELEGAFT